VTESSASAAAGLLDRQHRAIIDALARNDVDGVAVLLDEHLRQIPEITSGAGVTRTVPMRLVGGHHWIDDPLRSPGE
jgi:DNA-binding FadR family transcriptional regulator